MRMPDGVIAERLRLMFGNGNETAWSKGNGSGTRGLFQAWKRKLVEPVQAGGLRSPQEWRITAAGRDFIAPLTTLGN